MEYLFPNLNVRRKGGTEVTPFRDAAGCRPLSSFVKRQRQLIPSPCEVINKNHDVWNARADFGEAGISVRWKMRIKCHDTFSGLCSSEQSMFPRHIYISSLLEQNESKRKF